MNARYLCQGGFAPTVTYRLVRMRVWLGALVLMAACGRGESSPEGSQAVAGSRPESGSEQAGPEDSPVTAAAQPSSAPASVPYALPTATDAAWASVPTGTTADGATWQTIRHGTVHAHVALPAGVSVELGTLEYGHPVVRLRGDQLELQITFSSGTPRFVTTGSSPASLSNVRRVATDRNVTMAYTAQGERRVAGWTRSTLCEALHVTPANEDLAFRICASMQLPHPGALLAPRPAGSEPPWPAQPEHATVERIGTVRRMLTGHFSAQVNSRGPCPTVSRLHETYGADLETRERALPNGPALQGQLYERLGADRWPSGVVIWATRANYCCMASISGDPAPTEAQVTYVAELCDSLGQAPAPRSLEARRGDAVVSLTEGSGFLVDSNAPPPPPGAEVTPHPTLHGSCGGGDIAACSEAGGVVRAATTLEQVRAELEARGFIVTITP